MIENFKQYRVTYDLLKQFQLAYSEPLVNIDNVHPALMKASKDALKSKIEDFENEMNEFENKCMRGLLTEPGTKKGGL